MAAPAKLYTNSRSASFRACPRQHYYAYVQRYRAIEEQDARLFGTVIHAMLEAYWRARQAGLDYEQRLYAGLDVDRPEIDPFQRAKAESMFLAYTSIWDGIDVEVLAVERTFQFPMLNPETGSKSRTWVMAGKLDVLIRFRGMFHGQDFTGIIAFVEHKTSSEDTSPGSAYRKKLAMDGQCGQYFEGADALASVYGYERVDRGIYDVLAKPQIVPKKATPVEDRKYVEAKPAVAEEPARLYEGQHDHDETPAEFEARLAKVGGPLTAIGKKLKPFKATPVEKRKYTVAKPAQEAQPRRLHANMRETDETPDEYGQRCADKILADLDGYFAQIEVTRTAEAREEYLFDVWQQGQLMHESEVKKRAPKNPDACFKYGSQCDFWPVCADGVRLDDPTRYRVKEVDSEELVEPKTVLPAPFVVPTYVTPAVRDRMNAFEEADALARRKAAVVEVVAAGVEACHGEVVVEARSEVAAVVETAVETVIVTDQHRTPEGRYVFSPDGHVHTNWTGRNCTKCEGKGCSLCGGLGEDHDEVPPEQCGDTNCPKRVESKLTYRQRVIELRAGRGLSQQLATESRREPAPVVEPVVVVSPPSPTSAEVMAPFAPMTAKLNERYTPGIPLGGREGTASADDRSSVPSPSVPAPSVPAAVAAISQPDEIICDGCGNPINPDAECAYCSAASVSIADVQPDIAPISIVQRAPIVFDEDSVPTF